MARNALIAFRQRKMYKDESNEKYSMVSAWKPERLSEMAGSCFNARVIFNYDEGEREEKITAMRPRRWGCKRRAI